MNLSVSKQLRRPEEVRVLEILTSGNAARPTVCIEQHSWAKTCGIALILIKKFTQTMIGENETERLAPRGFLGLC